MTLPPAPQPGERTPDLFAYTSELPLFADMAATEQNPVFHGEGDVLSHTQLVCEQLTSSPAWQQLPSGEREVLWRAAMLHDCGKPATTRLENGRWRSPGHARVGSIIARRLLWQAGVPWKQREQICALIRWHMAPYWMLESQTAEREAIQISLACDPRLLMLLVSCDARGRIAPDVEQYAGNAKLAGELFGELGCGDRPYPFASDHSRFMFFCRDGRDPAYMAYDNTRCELTVLSGLPAAGKDTWAAEHAAGCRVVCLDDIRRKRRVRPGDRAGNGRVVAEAREQLKDALRAGENVVWNATSLSAQARQPLIQLAHDYRARVNVVCVEASPQTVSLRNRRREHPVADSAYERMLRRWEFPQLTECHTRQVVVSDR